MRYCKKCVQPDTRPGIYFSADGICGACLYEEEKKKIDWNARLNELKETVKQSTRNKKSIYDCVVGVSGGKDSTFQAVYSRDNLGLRTLLANCEPENITPIGKANIENLKKLGFDSITIRPNPIVMKKLIKKNFYNYLNPVKITEYSLYASAYIVAYNFKIPLIIQGDNPAFTAGAQKTQISRDGDALNANRMNTLSTGLEEFIDEEVGMDDLFLFRYERDKMAKEGYKGIWLQYYLKEWSALHNVEFSVKHGLRLRPADFNPYDIGTYARYNALDSDLVQVNQMLKYIKFGFGQCTDHANIDIRAGKITRQEGIELVKKYDGKCHSRYIKAFFDYIDIDEEEFWRVADSFRGAMWEKDSKGKWILKKPIWEQ